MSHQRRILFTALLCLAPLLPASGIASRVFASPSAESARAHALLVLAEDFQFHGGWWLENRTGTLGKRSLRTVGTDANALTAVEIPAPGHYAVWARGADYPDNQPGARRFGIAVNSELLPREAGQGGRENWNWERLGTVTLEAGPAALEIVDTTKFFGRCDAVFLSPSENPGDLDRTALLARRVKPLRVEPAPATGEAPAPVSTLRRVAPADGGPLATLEAGLARVSFRAARGEDGGPRVLRETEVRATPGDAWRKVPETPGAETLLLLHGKESAIDTARLIPRWRNPASLLQVRIGDRLYPAGYADDQNPWRAAPHTLLTARSARPLGADAVELTLADDTGRLTAALVWQTAPGGGDFVVTLRLRVPDDGFYSAAFAPFSDREADRVASHQLPPLYQFQRVPRRPNLLPSGVTPHPLVLIELKPGGPDAPALTLGVVASPEALPFEWQHTGNSRYGFTLQNDSGRVQPAAFQPVLGLDDSWWRAGETRTLRWHVLARPGGWPDALAYAAKHIFNAGDYRHPVKQSLTGSARAMIALMMDDSAGGWDRRRKGFWNIEGPGVVTQAAPLALLSAAVLTNDEQLYVERALPTIEYLLTRRISHFALKVPGTYPAYVTPEDLRLQSPNHYYRASFWQGVDALTGGGNPWLAPLAEDAARGRIMQPWVPRFAELLALHRLRPSPALLDEALREAESWVNRNLYSVRRDELDVERFYNHTFTPIWWDLITLHDLTGDARWLEAAELGAMLTVAGLRSQPAPADPGQPVLIHQGGRFDGEDRLWWKGDRPYRLGAPRTPGDVSAHNVPAWVVSPVGLGLEQPSTYFAASRNETAGFRNIMMSSWTPSLLRLYAKTGKDVYRDFARNGIVGRFGNYPGYYLRGFTDIMQAENYPCDGPDVTSIYYHHIPPHLAFTLDWLFAEAELRSGGEIRFPWSQQSGYVWFNNRVFGQGGGEIFGERDARPLLPRGVTVDDPGLNWIAARTPDRFWVVLMNDAPDARPARVRIDAAALRVDTQKPALVRTAAPGDTAPRPVSWTPGLTVPPRGLVALGFDNTARSEPGIEKLPPVTARPIAVDLGEPWGKLQAWRIRSPFGKDSLYLCLTGRPAEGARAELLIDDDTPAPPRVVDRFPYELTVYPFSYDRDARFRLRLTVAGGRPVTTDSFVLPGASPLQE